MAILAHVLIALTSLVFTAVVWAAPTQFKLRWGYGLMAATLVSGTYLIATTSGHMLQACVMGFLYLGIVLFGLVSARNKLAAIKNKSF